MAVARSTKRARDLTDSQSSPSLTLRLALAVSAPGGDFPGKPGVPWSSLVIQQVNIFIALDTALARSLKWRGEPVPVCELFSMEERVWKTPRPQLTGHHRSQATAAWTFAARGIMEAGRLRPARRARRPSSINYAQRLGVGSHDYCIACPPLGGDPLQISILPERLHGIFRQTMAAAPVAQNRTHVIPEGAAQTLLGVNQ